jgi:hypothetical protein
MFPNLNAVTVVDCKLSLAQANNTFGLFFTEATDEFLRKRVAG